MEAYKVLYLIRDLAKSMSEIGVKMDDYKYIGLCQEYNELVASSRHLILLVCTSSASMSIAVSASE